MKSQLLTTAFALLLLNLVAQETVNYTIDEDDPMYSNLMVGIEPFFIDISKGNIPLGVGISAQYLGKPINVSLVYNNAIYLDFNRYFAGAGANIKRHNQFEAGIGFPLSDRVKSKNLKVTLSESTSGAYTTTTFIMVPGTVRKITSVRGGIFRYVSSFDNEDWGDIVVDSVTLAASVQSYQPGINEWKSFYGNIVSTGIYGGLSFASISNLRISSEDFSGTRNHSLSSYFYIDGFFAPIVNAGTLIYTPDPGGFSLLAAGAYDLNDSYSKQRLGFRVGWQFVRNMQNSRMKRVGLSSRMEAGTRPGLKGGNWYMLLTVGIGINGRVGPRPTSTE